jgi:peroxiredoxin
LAALVATNGPGTSVVDVIGRLGRTNSLPLVLTVGLVGLWAFVLAALYQMLRQNGRMLRRLEAIEAKLGIPEEQLHPAGLPVKSAAPGFNLVNVDGRLVTSEMLRQRGKPLLLFFSEPNCSACEAMLPDVARWQREHEDHLVVVLVSRGDAEANRIKSRVHDLQNVLLQRDREVAEAYGVVATPSAVLVTDGLIASPLAIGPEFIGALVRDATTPPPLDRGDRVPSLELRDLNQGSMDLAALEGHRTLLLFWNPSCGFCDKMLDDVKAWECDRPPGAPDLVVISTGSPKANREQGFRSRVLLDPNFRAGNVFGATGTPSALMIDENGRVASEVVTGAPAVLALVGAAPAAARVRRK